MRNLPAKKGYAKHVKALGDELYAVEHFKSSVGNVAVVVLSDGRYFIGTAKLNPKDNYSRKLGHEIALGRALARAVNYPLNGHGFLWPEGGKALTGRELGKVCRDLVLTRLKMKIN